MSIRQMVVQPRMVHRRRPRRWLKIAIITLISLFLLALLTSAVIAGDVGWQLTHPARKVISKTPATYGFPFENITFPSRTDHLMLRGWLVHPTKVVRAAAHEIVILAHGYREGRGLDTPAFPAAKFLAAHGIATILFDFRDEGNSPGNLVSVGEFETRDLLGAVDYAKKLGYKHIGVLGFSMGASTTVLAASQDRDIQAVVLDSPFANLSTYLSAGLPHWSGLPSFPFTPLIMWEIPLLTGTDIAAVDPLADMRKLHKEPIFFIAGASDRTVPDSNTLALYAAVKNPADPLWLVPKAVHVGAYSVEPAQYLNRVLRFFQQNL